MMQLCYGDAIPGQDIGRWGLRDPFALSPFLQWESIVNPRSPKQRFAATPSDEYERRSRLVSLAYEVLGEMKTPTDETTNMAMFSELSRAFFEEAAPWRTSRRQRLARARSSCRRACTLRRGRNVRRTIRARAKSPGECPKVKPDA
jgi:hypothetical protein